ncbi:MAG TPA: hypothetical protein VK361_07675 [Rubrobacteraceae bacterium]|nr:hypothetical protein [Rubrobacteraceae bacterium]
MDRQDRSPYRRINLLKELDDLLAAPPQLLGISGDRNHARYITLDLDDLSQGSHHKGFRQASEGTRNSRPPFERFGLVTLPKHAHESPSLTSKAVDNFSTLDFAPEGV